MVRGCPHRTDDPDHELCKRHYYAVRDGKIKRCPNCGVICDPPPAHFCPQCGHKNQQIQEQQAQYADDSKGWNRPPEPSAETISPALVQAVELVRRNISRYDRESANHETNTVQYLVVPMLRGLGWDDTDPSQMVKEYKPAGRQRYRQAIAVDVALMDSGAPVAFIEAKRIDREFTDDFMEQLSKYAAHLEDGKTAVLTNGRFWIVCSVANGKPDHKDTIDVAAGKADDVAAKLNDVLGKSAIGCNTNRPSPRAEAPPQSAPDRDTIVRNLERYREQEASQGRMPTYVLTKEVRERIAEQCPVNRSQLRAIRGVGPTTVEQHGDAIIVIVKGQWP